MKRSIRHQYDQLQEKLKGYVAMMNFRYINLCIKADPVSLIPVKVNVEGTEKNLEQVAMTAKKDDYRFWIVPKYDEDKDSICKGIAKVHPEFKQKEDTLKIEGISEDGEAYDVHYIELTMPDVDDNRYNALKDAVDVVYQECKTLMEAAVSKAKAEIAFLSVGEPKEDIDGINKAVDNLNEKCEEQRDKLRDKKLQDIEDAYKKWLSNTEMD
mgnify:FL=1